MSTASKQPKRDRWARLAGSQGGFTLVEVLVAMAILAVGMYAAIAIFPTGFAVMEHNRNVSKAARLADSEIQRWKGRAASLPEAIVAQGAGGEVLTSYDLDRLVFDTDNVNWQPDATWLPRTIVGETIVIPSPRADADQEVPLYVLTMSPLDYDAPRLVVYSSPYQEVSSEGELDAGGDRQQFYVVPTILPGTSGPRIHLRFDTATTARRVMVNYSYYRARRDGSGAIVSQDVVQVISEVHDLPAGTRDLALNATDTAAGSLTGVVPGSVQVFQAFTQVASPTQSGEYALADYEGAPAGFGYLTGVLRFAAADVGRTVRVDYQVEDWQILRQEQTLGESGRITLLGAPIRRYNELRPPRMATEQPLDHITSPDEYVDVVAVNLETGQALYGRDITQPNAVTARVPGTGDPNPYWGTFGVDYLNGVCTLVADGVGADRVGHTWRFLYRTLDSWTVQVSKAAETYVPDTWATGRADQQYETAVTFAAPVLRAVFTFKESEAGKTVTLDYTYGYTQGGSYQRAMVHNALHKIRRVERTVGGQIRAVGEVEVTHRLPAGAALVTYPDGTSDFTVNWMKGASLRARAIWIGKGVGRAEGGEPVNERMFPQDVETYLTREQ